MSRLKKYTNPYSPITHKINSNEFVGREEQVDLLRGSLEDYKTTKRISNILVTGNKSVGKSTLLNRYKEILNDNNIAIYETELNVDPSTEISAFEFFKELYEDLFRRFSPEGKFFSNDQSEMWFDLTLNKYSSEMAISDRRLMFPTQYANLKNGKSEVLSYKNIESDFGEIIHELTDGDDCFAGLCIVIDEIQELERNTTLLDFLRRLSDNYGNLFVIGAGLPTFLNNTNFQKFVRTAIPINLNNLDESSSINLIVKPLETKCKLSRYDALHMFEPQTLKELLERSSGNPLHIRILCSYLFEAFKNDEAATKFVLNRAVMDKVMDYYCTVSSTSRQIKASLETANPIQLKSFKDLYQYEGLSIKSAILLANAFDSIQTEQTQGIKEKIFSSMEAIEDLGLFKYDVDIKTATLKSYTLDQLAQIKYKFVGEEIDKLYTSLYYQDLTKDRLIENRNDYEYLLSEKLSLLISDVIVKTKLKNVVKQNSGIWRMDDGEVDSSTDPDQIVKELSSLEKYQDKDAIKDSQKDDIRKISKKYELDWPAFLSSLHAYEGYYLILSSFMVRGKRKLTYNLLPVSLDTSEIIGIRERVEEIKSQISASLEEYYIELEWAYIYWWPKNPIEVVYLVNISDESANLYKLLSERQYDAATEVAKNIHLKSLRLKEDKLWGRKDKYNNFAYCLMNIGNFDEALPILEQTKDALLVSQLNIAYMLFMQNKYEEAKSYLKKIVRKKAGINQGSYYLHLTINHPLLEHGDKQVVNMSPYNVACWNMALISAQERAEMSTVMSFLKKIDSASKNSIIHKRAASWAYFYMHDHAKAIDENAKAIKECKDDKFLMESLEKDLECFLHEKK